MYLKVLWLIVVVTFIQRQGDISKEQPADPHVLEVLRSLGSEEAVVVERCGPSKPDAGPHPKVLLLGSVATSPSWPPSLLSPLAQLILRRTAV